METRYQHWQDYGLQVTQIGDSLTVKNGDTYVAGFRFGKGVVPGPIFSQYHQNGMIRTIDSLADGRGWHRKKYWGCMEGNIVYTRNYYDNGMPATFIYYFKENGKDSLIQRWYPNGVMKETTWNYSWGRDSVKYTWNADGMPATVKLPGSYKEFYPTGNIKSIESRTRIGKIIQTCIKTYYPTGVLKSVEYYDNDRSSNTWLYYTEEGTLKYKVEGASIYEILPYTVPAKPEEDICGIPNICEEEAIFPGGIAGYVYKNLPNIFCQSKKRLAGKYEIQFMVDTDGRAIFENFSGHNHTAILESVKGFIEKMPRWKPGKKNGRPMNVGLSLMLSLKKTSSNR